MLFMNFFIDLAYNIDNVMPSVYIQTYTYKNKRKRKKERKERKNSH